ncbi:MAG: hypothetical protein ACRC62_33530 [Microcoleus sp.]
MPRSGSLEQPATGVTGSGGKFIAYSPGNDKSYVVTVDANGGITQAYDNETATLLIGAGIPTDLELGSGASIGQTRWVTVTDTANANYGQTFPVSEEDTGTSFAYTYATGTEKGQTYTPPASGITIDIKPIELTINSRSLASSNAIAVGTSFSGISSYPTHGKGCIVEVGTNGTAPIIGITVRNTEIPIANPLLPPILPGITKATYVKTNLSDNPMPVGTVFYLSNRSDATAVQFRQLSDAEVSALLIGSPPSQILPQSTAIPFTPVQTSIPLGLTLPAVGAQVTVAMTPMTTASNQAFISGDTVIATESKTDQSTAKIAWFTVDSVAGDNVTMTHIARNGASAVGTVFAAGSTEITGQTRLPIPSPLVSVATVKIAANYLHVTDALSLTSTGYKVAKSLYDIQPVAYWCIKNAGSPDVDINTRMGVEANISSTIKIENRTDLENFRLVSAASLRYLPALEVVFS